MNIPDNFIKLREGLEFDCVSLGYTTINIYKINELITTQKDIEKEYLNQDLLVIGDEDLCGDLIYINTKDKRFPVYLYYPDENGLEPDMISVSFENFTKILLKIKDISFGRQNPNALEKNPIPNNIKNSILKIIEKENVGIYLEF